MEGKGTYHSDIPPLQEPQVWSLSVSDPCYKTATGLVDYLLGVHNRIYIHVFHI